MTVQTRGSMNYGYAEPLRRRRIQIQRMLLCPLSCVVQGDAAKTCRTGRLYLDGKLPLAMSMASGWLCRQHTHVVEMYAA